MLHRNCILLGRAVPLISQLQLGGHYLGPGTVPADLLAADVAAN